MKQAVSINGIQYTIVEVSDVFDADATHFGQIDYKHNQILINKDMSEEMKVATIYHEVLHGMLVSLGYDALSQDEQFVQALSRCWYCTLKEAEKQNPPSL